MQKIKNVKKIIAIGSGKGGVGKSTVATHLAYALKKQGKRVALLDADIYGPSQPSLMQHQSTRAAVENSRLQPVIQDGIQTMSIGYLIAETAPMVWRGPMIGKALQQLMHDTDWDDVDVMIIDLPPGTGDIQLTLCQKMALNGAIIVTTPQDLALSDVRRACEMFKKLNVPLLGVVENMSTFFCPNCNHETHLFGQGGGDLISGEYQSTLLGRIPLTLAIRTETEAGRAASIHDSKAGEVFAKMASQLLETISAQPKDYSALFSKVVVEHTKGASNVD